MTDRKEWLVLLHHLPPRPTRLRVRVWRRLQKLGAVAVKNSVYVLPWSDKAHEDFAWLQQEIESAEGEAVLFRANALADGTDSEIIAAFCADRNAAYARLAADLQDLHGRIAGWRRGPRPELQALQGLKMEVDNMRTRFNDIEETDYFKARGRTQAAAALDRCLKLLQSAQGRKARSRPPAGSKPAPQNVSRYQGRRWVTRPRPHVDRCASAWLIRRFIDRRPRFAFIAEGGRLRGAIPFDMMGVQFGHRGEDCTFETLLKEFGLERDAALRALAQIVHDMDLKDGKFGRPEAPGVEAVLRGLAGKTRDDRRLLHEAEAVFDALYATLATRPAKGRTDDPRKRR